MRLITLLIALMTTFGAQAETPKLQAAKLLHDKSCTSCHIRMYGQDGSKMYTRDGRLLSNKLEIQQRVASCNATVNAGWFPEEEESVADWLNKHYYRFDN
ncbi:cytochrome c [Dechloromonas sp. TW-R-39-2]|uniref:cytochrome c n=1 Tax=Dechloromonas sp. TW-R-39-2 TaxID=2654218 RepID=UPI00193D5233|nr:cytochrome c [Dechloromonas sp. TW-R-39-2]QRM19839.1 cytochrome c [Dechloromonas sp. TW-R-39-2]